MPGKPQTSRKHNLDNERDAIARWLFVKNLGLDKSKIKFSMESSKLRDLSKEERQNILKGLGRKFFGLGGLGVEIRFKKGELLENIDAGLRIPGHRSNAGLRVAVDPRLSKKQLTVALTALADFYRKCGGSGLISSVEK